MGLHHQPAERGCARGARRHQGTQVGGGFLASHRAAMSRRIRLAARMPCAVAAPDTREHGQQELARLRSLAGPSGRRRRGDFDLLGHRIVAGEGLICETVTASPVIAQGNGAKLCAEKVSPTRIRFAFSTSLTSEEALLVLSLKLPLPL